jgi:preprotein translocase subunit SecG
MLMTILNVVYVLLAVAMIAMILMQRGAGASAGSGFGGGASATVFGARGASNFLSKSTKWMAIVFFGISLFMAWHATRSARSEAPTDLGVMAQLPAGGSTPQAPAGVGAVPAAPAATQPASESGVPAAPQQQPAAAQPTQSQPTQSQPAQQQPAASDAQPATQTPPQN